MDDTHTGQARPGNFTDLTDPEFLAERARVRGLLEHQPENSADRAELERVYEAMTAEFCRRASIAWQQEASAQPGSGGARADNPCYSETEGPMEDSAPAAEGQAAGGRTRGYSLRLSADEVLEALEPTRKARLALDALASLPLALETNSLEAELLHLEERISAAELDALRSGGVMEYLIIRPINPLSPPGQEELTQIGAALRTLDDLGLLFRA